MLHKFRNFLDNMNTVNLANPTVSTRHAEEVSNQAELSSSYCCWHVHKVLIHQPDCWNRHQYIWMNRGIAAGECDTFHRSPQI